MSGSGIDDLARSLLETNGQGVFSEGNQNSRNMYPAIVISIDDPLEQNRIIARIINLDKDGNILGGRDRDVPDSKLPMCIPCGPEHIHIRPLVGEMVILFLENPSDNSAPRYWSGPIVNSKLKLKTQAYKEAIKIMDYTDFSVNQNINNKPKTALLFPEQADVAIQGRDDSDLILRPKEAYLVAGKFKPNTFDQNLETPSYLRLKQINKPKNISQASLTSTNVNVFSINGKFRSDELAKYEINPDLESFGDLAKTLHPVAFGDEVIKVLDVIIRYLLTHIHTAQNPPLTTPEFTTLQEYTISGKLQNLISNHIRVN